MAGYNSQHPSYAAIRDLIDSLSHPEHVTYQSPASPARGASYAWGSGNPSSTVPNDIGLPANYCKTRTPEYFRMLEKRKNLPIWNCKEEIVQHIQSSQVVIIEGETGSGKSTQVPQWCLELPGMKQVVCTQPRRIAAISLAQRVAQEMDVRLGQEVGYVVRFERKMSLNTLLKYVTDGVLLREAMQDHALSNYDLIIIDEVHERRIVTDIFLGVIKNILPFRPELKVVIMSATLNADKFCEFFDGCPHLTIPGKTHPVEMTYAPKVPQRVPCEPDRRNTHIEEYAYDAVNTVLEICAVSKSKGDIMVFVTGREEIDFICDSLEGFIGQLGLAGYINIIPLYGDLPYNSQQKIFEPPPHSTIGKIGRKCIVSTNIAETSITIEGVVFVIDSGKVKLNSLAGGGHMKSLLPVDISQSSANQRAGRAGRTQPGICYRLYSESEFLHMAKDTIPEILRCDLSDVILQLKASRIDIQSFQSIDQPCPNALKNALLTLKVLGALDSREEITEVGTQMSMFSVEPEVARMLVASNEYACQEEILTLAAMLSGDRPGSVFFHGGKKRDQVKLIQSRLYHHSGDHLTYVNVYNEFVSNESGQDWCKDNYINYRILWEAERIREQLLAIMTKLKLMPSDDSQFAYDNHPNVMKAILTGYIGNVAHLNPVSFGGRQKFITVQKAVSVMFHPSNVHSFSSSKPLVCYSTCIRTNPKQSYISMVSYIEEEWYEEVRSDQARQGQAFVVTALKNPKKPQIELLDCFRDLSLFDD